MQCGIPEGAQTSTGGIETFQPGMETVAARNVYRVVPLFIRRMRRSLFSWQDDHRMHRLASSPWLYKSR